MNNQPTMKEPQSPHNQSFHDSTIKFLLPTTNEMKRQKEEKQGNKTDKYLEDKT